jgi:hypothetical protein
VEETMTVGDVVAQIKAMLDKLASSDAAEESVEAKEAKAEGEKMASLQIGDEVIALAAGQEAEVEIARSGKFVDMNKNVVEVTPALMKDLAASIDLEKHEPKLKLGHEPIRTDTPDLGSVVGLAYDEAKDRLMAKIRPTMALVKRVREGAFNQRSMEFARDEKGGVRFLHLGFLGARKPAISGLAPVALAAGEPEATVLCTESEDAAEFFAFGLTAAQRKAVADEDFAGPNHTFPIDSQAHLEAAASLLHHAADPTAVKAKAIAIAKRKGLILPATWSLDTSVKSKPVGKIAAAEAVTTPDAEEKVKMASEATIERLRAQVKDGAKDRVRAFLAANSKRIPLGVVKAGVEDGLVALMATEADSETPFTFKLSESEEAKPVTASAFVMAILSAMPEQITAAESTETVKTGAEEASETPAEFADADKESVEMHLATEREIAEAKGKGETINYLEGVLRVERKRRGASK